MVGTYPRVLAVYEMAPALRFQTARRALIAKLSSTRVQWSPEVAAVFIRELQANHKMMRSSLSEPEFR